MSNCEGVFVVVYGNYNPAEADSVWATDSAAQCRAEELNRQSYTENWNVEYWPIEEDDED